MSTEEPKDTKGGKRKKPRRNVTPSAAPTKQDDNSPSNLDHKSSSEGKQISECTCNCHFEPDSSGEGRGPDRPNHRLEGIDDDDYLIPMKLVEHRTGLNRSTVDLFMRTSDFPLPLKMSERAVRWSSNEVDRWILTRKRAKGDLSKRHSKLEGKTQEEPADEPEHEPEIETEEQPEAELEDVT